MSLIEHAKAELALIDDGSEEQAEINKHVLALVGVFAEEGHSGFSAAYTVGILEKLLRFEPLKPLTGADDEWIEVTDGTFQNRRCSHVFKEGGLAYDINGIIWRDPDGCTFTNFESRVPVEFPYTPKSEVRDRPSEAA